MEIALVESVTIPVTESSQTAEARRLARGLASRMDFDEARADQIALVVTEACTNLVKYTGGGTILLQATRYPDAAGLLEMFALDQGPGMNLAQCMRDGYSTADSLGQGLGAMVRLSEASDFYSTSEKGSAAMTRWTLSGPPPPSAHGMQIGAVTVPKNGQDVCGDAWTAVDHDGRTTILVADGLGHGFEAGLASTAATRVLHRYPALQPRELLERSHDALRATRGAAVAVARIDPERRKLTFAGVGNIAAQIYSGSRACQHLVSVNGTAGLQSQRLREFSYTWPEDGILILHSDGLTSATGLELYPRLHQRDPSLIAAVLYRDFSRGHDDSTVVVVKVV